MLFPSENETLEKATVFIFMMINIDEAIAKIPNAPINCGSRTTEDL